MLTAISLSKVLVRFLRKPFFFFFFKSNYRDSHILPSWTVWCMLGVFLLPAFTCLGHESLNVRIFRVHAMECMCAQTRPRFRVRLGLGLVAV